MLGVSHRQSAFINMIRHGFKPIQRGNKGAVPNQSWLKSDVGEFLAKTRRKPPENKDYVDLYWECLRSFADSSRSEIDSHALKQMAFHENGNLSTIKRLFREMGIDFELVYNNGYAVGLKVGSRA